MDATVQVELEQAVISAARGWVLVSGGDPNTIDLLHYAWQLEDARRLRLTAAFPVKGDGVAIVELVERHFVAAPLIRQVPPVPLAARAVALVDAITGARLHAVDPVLANVTALYTWHGCIILAKLLRPTTTASQVGRQSTRSKCGRAVTPRCGIVGRKRKREGTRGSGTASRWRVYWRRTARVPTSKRW
jgi:hypothetical protein